MAAWDAYCRVAHASHVDALNAVRSLIEEGAVELELDTGAVLHLISNLEMSPTSQRSEDHPGRKAQMGLIAAGVLVPDETGDTPRTTWRLEPQALLTRAKDRRSSRTQSSEDAEIRRFGHRLRRIDIGDTGGPGKKSSAD